MIFIRKVSAWCFWGTALPGLGRQFIPSVSTRAAFQNCIIHTDPYAAQNSLTFPHLGDFPHCNPENEL